MASTMTKDEFIAKARKVHGDLYDYSQVQYKNNKTKVQISDPDWGYFEQTPYAHLRGQGHPKRGAARISEQKVSSVEEFIRKAREVHGDLYDYSYVQYKRSRSNVLIFDPEHGFFEQTPSNHLRGKGSPKRGRILHAKNTASTTEEFIRKAILVHGSDYDYSLVKYVNCFTPVRIVDPVLNCTFEQSPNNHLRGNGNPKRTKREYKYNYITEVRTRNGEVRCLKYGIEGTYNARSANQNRKSVHEVHRVHTYMAKDYESCIAAENECKVLIQVYNVQKYGRPGVLTKVEMMDGFTETAEEHFLQAICDIYEKHGAVLLSPSEYQDLQSSGKMVQGRGSSSDAV